MWLTFLSKAKKCQIRLSAFWIKLPKTGIYLANDVSRSYQWILFGGPKSDCSSDEKDLWFLLKKIKKNNGNYQIPQSLTRSLQIKRVGLLFTISKSIPVQRMAMFANLYHLFHTGVALLTTTRILLLQTKDLEISLKAYAIQWVEAQTQRQKFQSLLN